MRNFDELAANNNYPLPSLKGSLMFNKLPAGCFMGEVVIKRRFEGLILTETQHDRSNWLPVHAHQNAYFCFVRRGEYTERYNGNQERLCKPMTLTFHPPEERHTE